MNKNVLFSIVAVVTIVLDQITKYWARTELRYGVPKEVIAGWWDWRLSYNTGSAFGLFAGMSASRIFLSVVGVIAFAAIVWILRKTDASQRALVVALGLVGGGAIGNVIDRILAGKVTDFVVWKYKTFEWPAFNIADVALVVGVGLLFLDVGRRPAEEQPVEGRPDEGTRDEKRADEVEEKAGL